MRDGAHENNDTQDQGAGSSNYHQTFEVTLNPGYIMDTIG